MFYAINFWKVGDISFFQFFFGGEGGEIILDNFLFFKDSFFIIVTKLLGKVCLHVCMLRGNTF